MCLNKRVLIGLVLGALALFAVSPRLLGAAAPLLFLAACPLSMLFTMRRMGGQGASCATGSADTSGERVGASTRDAELRELQEEVNRLKAEMQLRSQASSA